MTFENKSPAQVAEELAWGPVCRYAKTQEEEILQAIHHFSNRNLVAARRYEYLKTKLKSFIWVAIWFARAERLFPDA